MADKLIVDLENVRVTWMGRTNKNQQGKDKPSIQAVREHKSGRIETYEITAKEEFTGLLVGDRINCQIGVTAFNDKLYLGMNEFHTVPAAGRGGALKV